MIVFVLAITLNHMGLYYQSLGRMRDAERLYAQAFAMVEQTPGPASETGIEIALNLSTAYLELDEVSQAESLIRRIIRTGSELSPSNRAVMRAELASILARKQDFHAAESLYLESMRVFERDPRREFRERTIIALSNLSTLYMRMNRFAEGRTFSERARARLQTMPDPPFVLAFKTTANAAVISVRTGRPDEAETLFRSAIALCEKQLGRNYYLLGKVLNNYAEFLRSTGRRADARSAVKRAREILAGFGKENSTGLTVDVTAFR